MKRVVGPLLAVVLLLVLSVQASAVKTRFWYVDTRDDLTEGKLDGVSIDADGVVRLAPDHELLIASDEIYFWELIERGDGWLVGTGDTGQILEIGSSGEKVLADLELLEVMAIATSPDGGTIYAAGAPGGAVLSIDRDGSVETFFDSGQGVVWDIAVAADGTLYVATGEAGHLYRVAPGGESERLHVSADAHLMCVALLPDGALVVGSAGDGLVSRVGTDGDVRVLFDASEEEVRALAVASDGTIYAALNVARGDGKGDSRPVVYKIGAFGDAQRVWRARNDFIFGFALDRNGDLLVGTAEEAALYRIDPSSRRATRLAEFEETSILGIAPGKEALVVTTGDPARAYRLGTTLRSSGTVQSTARDAGAQARWSRVRWVGETPPGTCVSFETRTGNRGTPDDTWSDWARATPGRGSFVVTSPPARFLQWRLELEGSQGRTPAVSSVVTSYREINLAPEMLALDVSRKGAELFAGIEGRSRSVRQKLAGGVEVDFSLPGDAGAAVPLEPGDAGWARGLRTVTWIGTDPNGDELTFRIEYRPVESERWLLLDEELTDFVHTWDTSAVPDGEYKIRVTASDERGNTGGEARSDSRVSSTFEIDNTPPEVKSIEAKISGSEVSVRARARDARSAIVRAELSLDGKTWTPARPESGFLDDASFELDLEIAAGTRTEGDPLVLRLTDEAGNQVVARAFIR